MREVVVRKKSPSGKYRSLREMNSSSPLAEGKLEMMLFALLVTVLLSPVPDAHAAVVDKFRCELSQSNEQGELVFETRARPGVARKPLEGQGPVNATVKITQGTTFLSTHAKEGSAMADLTLHYRHAIKSNAAGKPVRALQATCTSFCVRFPEGGGMCGDCAIPCSGEGESPFEASCEEWKEVKIESGVPAFAQEQLKPIELNEHGKTLLSCEYLKTTR